jgi:hypothetical protein
MRSSSTSNANSVELDYEVIGAGEPVLLVSPVLAGGFLPLLAEPALADRYQLIRCLRSSASAHAPIVGAAPSGSASQ